jgi:serine/threonine protein kinase
VIQLYEVLYSEEHPYLYLVTEDGDLGTLMCNTNVDGEYKYYHNYELITHMIKVLDLEAVQIDIQKNEENNNIIIRRNTLPYDIKRKIAKVLFFQILKAVEYIHSKKVAHRDIKPDNIVASSDKSQIKLIDFSISSIYSNSEIQDEPGGTISFQGI